ncbi:RNA-guided endonuclease InsQ/TnpB family protein [Photobacterium phosphoreum]|jgi:putative transposase|uniref:RNA-guided endonuclease InsQ/TnpB family protein n=1 Tax=Photobacterium phosphoreum TaxID=659 RepID=UPI000D16482B|nr:RNA-guided endonuclease TnpB family protein [Photobacterium phosphoreum]PSU63250.1 transposase [Photobacterium phosphoreum]
MLLAHKIELRPTEEQADYLNRACGSRRHAFNQLLAHFNQDGVKWSKKEANAVYKAIREQFPWYAEVSQRVTRNAVDDLHNAFSHFFRRIKNGEKAGYPKFKRKGQHDSFALREKPKFDVDGRTLRIEKLKTRIKLRQGLRFTGTPCQVTISKRAGKFFASILVDSSDYDPKDQQCGSVGVDFGIKDMAVCSNGHTFKANQKLKYAIKKLKRRQRALSRKKKGSNRYAKAKLAVAKLHYRISNQRLAVLHEISDYLTKNFKVITIENLNVKGMIRNRKLSRAIADCGFGMLRQFIEYKADFRDCTVVIADRFYPSSKTCHLCKTVNNELILKQREWRCECGARHDRDFNASINLDIYGRDTLQLDLKPYTIAT